MEKLNELKVMGLDAETIEKLQKISDDLCQRFAAVAASLDETFRTLARDLTPAFHQISLFVEQLKAEEAMVDEAVKKGLVSSRVKTLYAHHRKAKVSKKNLNRVRKELALYEKRTQSR
jgi:hypothetical protein